MKKLIIHAGLHKTGTTSIQEFLFRNKLKLEKDNFSVFMNETFGNVNHRTNCASWFDQTKLSQGICKIKDDFYFKIGQRASDSKITIISSECFSWINSESEIMKISQKLKVYFDEIKVIFYIRRQDKLAVSHYQQRAKTVLAEGEYYKDLDQPLPLIDENTINYFDYFTKIKKWCDAFDKNNLIVRNFDQRELLYGNVLADFQNVIGCKDIIDADISENTSISIESLKVSYLLRSNGVKFNNPFYQEALKISTGNKFLPSREKALLFYKHFKESNVKLNSLLNITDREHIFCDSFSDYPECESQISDHCYLEYLESTSFLINNYVREDDKKIDLIRDASIKLINIDIDIAIALMELAKSYRPSGGFINDSLLMMKDIQNKSEKKKN